ncbi:metallophosphoesterase [Alloalcanivorax mobilis]|uniref:metallophosphoesterase n=1 Tax=Alloalcanivorax mobilis TaxID=2019569 RepID=UPI000B5B3355|nr:metallophosphoesterase [Alloalcanivorax mobilis]ASK33772.1 hypothetical protein CEK62_04895 [Alcanivorax sp. N3-2A]
MRILALSDLHNELLRDQPVPPSLPQVDCDVIVLAGDIDTGARGVRWAADQARQLGKPILYVAGNHEHYGQDIGANLRALRHCARGTGVTVLENERLDLHGVRFLGCTLWTDYRAGTAGDVAESMAVAGARLPDHRLIRSAGAAYTPEQALRRHRASVSWLGQELASPFDGPTVVISHHGPSRHCAHPRFSPGPLDGAFFSLLDDLVSQADLWIYGHTHISVDTTVGECRLVSNQRGYQGEDALFDERRVIVL